MNFKGALLVSAAAVLTASGVHAADTVAIAEPETAEYVRICDLYGAGYVYIPGTETCLRLGGFVRYDASFGDGGRANDGRSATDRMTGEDQNTWKKNARFSLKMWTGQETELGTLKTYADVRFNFGNTDLTVDGTTTSNTLNFAWIQLGGLRVGKDETAYDTFIGYAGSVIQDSIIPYGIKNTNLISYYFDAGNGLSAVASLEEGSGAADTIDSYVPHVVGGVKYKGDWGAITAVGAYNSNWEEWAGKVRLDLNATEDLTFFAMAGYGSDNNVAKNFYKPWTGNFAVWGGGTYKVTKKVSLNAQVSYTDEKDFAVAANVAYSIVPGYTITAEVDYFDNFDISSSDAFGGIVRFQRSF